MSIKISEHILSLDENILGVTFFSNKFHMVEGATRPNFDRQLKVSNEIEGSIPAYVAAVHGMTRMVEEPFGAIEKITIDYDRAKLMLLPLKNEKGFIGLVLNKYVNSDYLAPKILQVVEETEEEIGALI